MKTRILEASVRVISPMMAGYSLYVLLKGHNEPGGGFIGGLLLALALVYADLGGAKSTSRLPLALPTVIGIGASLCLFSTLLPMLLGQPALTGSWWFAIPLPLLGDLKVGSVLVFDFGVYFLVAGVVLKIITTVSEAGEAQPEQRDFQQSELRESPDA